MSSLDPREPPEAALRRMVREARAEPAPDLDWSSMEERLLSQTRAAPPSPRKASFHPYAWGALAAAAAAAVLWLLGTHGPSSVPPAPRASLAAPQSAVTNGDTLALGSRVEAQGREVAVEHAGRAKWSLAPGSSALLMGRNERVTVQLERGSVLSRVVPNPKPETFVVQAASTRIAVHGTVFRVALEGGRVLVDVSEGTVGVGPLGDASAFLLKAPAHGDFEANGRSGRIDGRWVSAGRGHHAGRQKLAPRGSGLSPASGVPLAPATSAEPPVEPSPVQPPANEPPANEPTINEPTINDIEAGVARIVDATSDCFMRHTQSAEGVQITVHTALSLKILGSGVVADLDFQPPLSPGAEACAAASIAQVRFASSEQGAQVTRLLELKK